MASNAYWVLWLVFAWGRDAVLQRQREEIENLRMRLEDYCAFAFEPLCWPTLPPAKLASEPEAAAPKPSIEQQREELERYKMAHEEARLRICNRIWNEEEEDMPCC